jgi:hypothetical protein
MTPEAARGRRIVIGIACLSAAPPVLMLLVSAASGRYVPISAWLSNGAVNVLLAWLLIKGRPWVRMLTVLGFALGGTLSIVQVLLSSAPIWGKAVIAFLGAVQLCGALILVLSPAVRAYFQAENNPTALKLDGAA